MDCGAAQDSALPVEQVAVGGLAIEQPRDLVDEPLEHRLELELARDDLGRTQECRLLQQPPSIFFEQARCEAAARRSVIMIWFLVSVEMKVPTASNPPACNNSPR